ncbi:MAG TPA: VacJ family lipoprotein [Thermodesulfobacteriota bacterium]|nr:VacJ family lipoprotein [Thermodesulfobacteriota bacterium]
MGKKPHVLLAVFYLSFCFFTLFCVGNATASFSTTSFQHHSGLHLSDVPLTLSSSDDRVLLAAASDEGTSDQSAPSSNPALDNDDEFYDPFGYDEEQADTIADPIQSVNRPLYVFNDKVYFWLLKPAAQGYGHVMPEPARQSVKKFFFNLRGPIRFVNCLLQGKGCGAVNELSRFTVNTTVGILGFFDPATNWFHLQTSEEDFGQTLGRHMGPGFFLTVPFKGPSSLRDSVGSLVDLLIVPTWYVISNYGLLYTGVQVFEAVNETSLTIGEYEDLKAGAIDPYIAIRDAYYQHREDLIER